METNNKFLIITANKRLYQGLAQVIKGKGYDIETDISSLYDIEHIKKMLKITKNTLFLREAYSNFIKKFNGPPLAIIMDYKIDLNLEKELDPDNMKVLKTFLISSIILSHITNLIYNVTNLICIGKPDNLSAFNNYTENPHLIFKLLNTNNPQINKLIEERINHPDRTKKIFFFDYLLIDEKNDVISAGKKLELIIDGLVKSKQSHLNKEMTKHQTEILKGEFEPAKIFFKISPHRIYIEGEIHNIEQDSTYDNLEENVIYVKGYYVNSTLTTVNEKIRKFIFEDLPKIRKITMDTEINITIDQATIIDGSSTPSLNIFLTTKLRDFKNIRLITSPENFNKMARSPGFISIRNYIIKKL